MFRARLREPEFGVGPESLEVRFYEESEIPWPDIAFLSVEFALRRYLDDRRDGASRAHAFRDIDWRDGKAGQRPMDSIGSLMHAKQGTVGPRIPTRPCVDRRPRSPESSMTFVVTESCIKCKYTDCVEVCPVDCFHEGPNFLVIDPDECIDCTLCEPECPVEAIYSEEELPAGQEQFKQLNADLAKNWPVITEKKAAPPDAKEWEGKPDKAKLLER